MICVKTDMSCVEDWREQSNGLQGCAKQMHGLAGTMTVGSGLKVLH